MKFDVFISFRGTDTRRTFVSHLLLSLHKKQITTYKHEVERQKPPDSQVLQAIEESKIVIVVISKKYVTSSWCLEELAMIFESKKKPSVEVVPVLYEVNTSDVLGIVDGDHGYGDNNLEKVKKWKDALKKLIDIYDRNYLYWENHDDSYSYIIKQVVNKVSHLLKTPIEDGSELAYSPPEPPEKPPGPKPSEKSARHKLSKKPAESEKPAEPIPKEEPKPPEYIPIDSEMPNTFPRIVQLLWFFVTIWIKLAAVFRMITSRFMYGEVSSGVKPRQPVGLLDVQNENYVISKELSQLVLSNDFNSFVGMDRLMKDVKTLLDLESREAVSEIGIYGERGVGKTTLARCIYEELSPQFQDHHYFINETMKCYPGACLLDYIARTSLTEQSESFQEYVKLMLGHRKVLLIVDNMLDDREIENIRNIARWFGPESRLIMVTKTEHVLHGMERRYEVKPLRYDEALQLFSQSAFKQKQVPREYYQLSVRAVIVTGRIPLALKVFGNFLCGKQISEWERELCTLETPEFTWEDCVANFFKYIRRALS